MTNKGLAFSLGGVKKAQSVKPRPGLNKPFKASALSVFEAPEEGSAKEDVQQTKRQRLEPAGCCAFPVMLLLSSERMLELSAPDPGFTSFLTSALSFLSSSFRRLRSYRSGSGKGGSKIG